ncbi:uncharacterized protein LOC126803272 [Argentina anserina]|uniref:uncharacterized protein LOC126803272 n=1 Tax=Argentina anserina TaxID=57926 RepID=UPI00217658CD|nr:uncharacterized protein LOC126803272 [Potentilla anserina]
MRCKKHAADLTSTVGVCASCLRERLTTIIEAQTRAQGQLQIQAQLSCLHSRNSGVAPEEQPHHPNPPPPLIFPRSVSPYVSRRKSDDSAWPHHHSRSDHDHDNDNSHSHQRHHIRFYSTPQVGPTYDGAPATIGGSCKKSRPRFSLLTSLFRSRSDKFWTDPRVSSRDSIPTSASAAASPSWLSSIFAGKRGKKSKQCFADETPVRVRSRHRRARGMSPDFTHDGGGDDCEPSASGSGDSSTPDWKRTPVQATPSRRTRSGPVKNVSGLTFCLSPLVRAHWNQKGMQGFPPEHGITGEIRVATRPHLSSAASFSMNRSRKLADFGRVTSNR